MDRHPISIFRLLSRTNTLTLDPCNWLPRHLTGARMRAPQILVLYYYPPANDLTSSSWSAFAPAEHHKMHSSVTACNGAMILRLAPLKTQSGPVWESSAP